MEIAVCGMRTVADNLVNLLVAEDIGSVSVDEVLRVLVPKGVAYVKQDGRWSKTLKPWPRGIDEWSHHCHGPDGNPVARDRVVGPPKRFQWIAGPKWMRAHDTDSSVNALVSAGGRVFYMAAADGQLFITLKNGNVVCVAQPQDKSCL